jgi:hypothetical protein
MNLNRTSLALIATAALAASALRAETRVSFGIHVGGPAYVPAPPAVVYAPPPVVVYAPPPTVVYAPASGYWKEIVVNTWVPERWVHSRDRWGRSVRLLEPGHYALRTDRVWVDARDACRPAPRFPTRGHAHWGR